MSKIKTYHCESTLVVDIEDLTNDYLTRREELADEGVDYSIAEFIDTYWVCQDDNVYYCDNADEIKAQLCNAIKEEMADGNK